MKKYLAGFIAGVLVSVSTVGVFATVKSYTLDTYSTPIYINGVKYPTDALPVLTLDLENGENTYVPLRNFSEMIGANVNYNQAQARIDITSSNNRGTNSSSNNNKYKDKDKNKDKYEGIDKEDYDDDLKEVSDSVNHNETYGLNVYTINGLEYVDINEIESVYFDNDYKEDNDKYEFDENENNENLMSVKYGDRVVLNNVEILKVDGDELVLFEIFVNEIYSIIKI